MRRKIYIAAFTIAASSALWLPGVAEAGFKYN
jgi:hypothetical protein